MTTQARLMPSSFNTTAVLRLLLAALLLVVLVAGAGWLALRPASITDVSGVVTRIWVEPGAQGQPGLYWVEIQDGRAVERCAVAPYQTQLVEEWQELRPGMAASLTCYGQSAVSLTGSP